jgi:hypothetical protein
MSGAVLPLPYMSAWLSSKEPGTTLPKLATFYAVQRLYCRSDPEVCYRASWSAVVVSTLTSYSGDTGFEFRPGNYLQQVVTVLLHVVPLKEISGSPNGEYEDHCLPGCCSV